jgi:hypothetical protein
MHTSEIGPGNTDNIPQDLLGTAEFTPGLQEVNEGPVDRAEALGAIGQTALQEPFGVDFAIESAKKPEVDTSKSTGAKGGGNYDDYHTKSE